MTDEPIHMGWLSLPAELQQAAADHMRAETQRHVDHGCPSDTARCVQNPTAQDDDLARKQTDARRQLGLNNADRGGTALYPDDPDRAARHDSAIALLRGSLAKQIERGKEGRA